MQKVFLLLTLCFMGVVRAQDTCMVRDNLLGEYDPPAGESRVGVAVNDPKAYSFVSAGGFTAVLKIKKQALQYEHLFQGIWDGGNYHFWVGSYGDDASFKLEARDSNNEWCIFGPIGDLVLDQVHELIVYLMPASNSIRLVVDGKSFEKACPSDFVWVDRDMLGVCLGGRWNSGTSPFTCNSAAYGSTLGAYWYDGLLRYDQAKQVLDNIVEDAADACGTCTQEQSALESIPANHLVVSLDDHEFKTNSGGSSIVNFGEKTWNIFTNGGFTFVTKLKIDSSVSFGYVQPRIFAAHNDGSDNQDRIVFQLQGTASLPTIYYRFQQGISSCGYYNILVSTDRFVNLVWRYKVGEDRPTLEIDGVLAGGTLDGGCGANFLTSDRTLKYNKLNQNEFSGSDAENFAGEIAGFYGFDRWLDDAEAQTVLDSIVVHDEDTVHKCACNANYYPTSRVYPPPTTTSGFRMGGSSSKTYDVALTGSPYANGQYKIEYSSCYQNGNTYCPHNAFVHDNNYPWYDATWNGSPYTGPDNTYAGTGESLNGVDGQWIKIQLPEKIVFTGITTVATLYNANHNGRMPKTFKVFARNDDQGDWVEVYHQASTATPTFSAHAGIDNLAVAWQIEPSSATAYNTFALVVLSLINPGASTSLVVSDILLYGYALEHECSPCPYGLVSPEGATSAAACSDTCGENQYLRAESVSAGLQSQFFTQSALANQAGGADLTASATYNAYDFDTGARFLDVSGDSRLDASVGDIYAAGQNDITISFWVAGAQYDTTRHILRVHPTRLIIRTQKIPGGTKRVLFYDFRDAANNMCQSFVEMELETVDFQLVTVVKSGTSVTVYLNGAPVSASAYNAQATSCSGGLAAGTHATLLSHDNNNNHFFRGKLRDLRVYNRAIAPEEVAELYDLPAPECASCPAGATSPAGSTSIDDCSCLSDTYKAENSEISTHDNEGPTARFKLDANFDADVSAETYSMTPSTDLIYSYVSGVQFQNVLKISDTTSGSHVRLDGLSSSVLTTIGTNKDFAIAFWFKVDNTAGSTWLTMMQTDTYNSGHGGFRIYANRKGANDYTIQINAYRPPEAAVRAYFAGIAMEDVELKSYVFNFEHSATNGDYLTYHVKLFVDGVASSDNPESITFKPVNTEFYLFDDANDYRFEHVYYKDVRIYDRALSLAETQTRAVTVCQACPAGATSPANSTSADSCKCAADSYKDGGSCQACPAGASSPAGSTSADSCVCQANTYAKAVLRTIDNTLLLHTDTGSHSWSEAETYAASQGGRLPTLDELVAYETNTGYFAARNINEWIPVTNPGAPSGADYMMAYDGHGFEMGDSRWEKAPEEGDPISSSFGQQPWAGVGQYPVWFSSDLACVPCPASTMTLSAGATGVDDCVCKANSYDNFIPKPVVEVDDTTPLNIGGPLSWNVQSNGGLTIITKVYITSTITHAMIFNFGLSAPRINILRNLNSNHFYVQFADSSNCNTPSNEISLHAGMSHNKWYDVVLRYDLSTHTVYHHTRDTLNPSAYDDDYSYPCPDGVTFTDFQTEFNAIAGYPTDQGGLSPSYKLGGKVAGLYAFDKYIDDEQVDYLLSKIQTDDTDDLIVGCTSCPPGATSPANSTSADSCVLHCGINEYSNGDQCTRCPAGTISPANSTSADSCVCAANSYKQTTIQAQWPAVSFTAHADDFASGGNMDNYAFSLWNGVAAKLVSGWTHTGWYAHGFLRSGAGDSVVEVSGLLPGHEYLYATYNFHDPAQGQSWGLNSFTLHVNGAQVAELSGQATNIMPTYVGKVLADADGKILFKFTHTNEHLHLSGLTVEAVCQACPFGTISPANSTSIAACKCQTGAYASAYKYESLTAWYKFETDARDYGPYNMHLQPRLGATPSFNAEGYITASNDISFLLPNPRKVIPTGTTAFTVSFWVKNWNFGYIMRFRPSNLYFYEYSDASKEFEIGIEGKHPKYMLAKTTSWTLLVAVFTTESTLFYQDGVQVLSDTSNKLPSGGFEIEDGEYAAIFTDPGGTNTNSHSFQGDLKDLRFYNTAFTPSEVNELYTGQAGCAHCGGGLTTLAVGAESVDQCVCKIGLFDAAIPPAILTMDDRTMTSSATTAYDHCGIVHASACQLVQDVLFPFSTTGVSIVLKMRFTSSAINYERVFAFSQKVFPQTGATGDHYTNFDFAIFRLGTTNTLQFNTYTPGDTSCQFAPHSYQFSANEELTMWIRYDPTSTTMKMSINGVEDVKSACTFPSMTIKQHVFGGSETFIDHSNVKLAGFTAFGQYLSDAHAAAVADSLVFNKADAVVKCMSCAAGLTTLAVGAESAAACVCQTGSFKRIAQGYDSCEAATPTGYTFGGYGNYDYIHGCYCNHKDVKSYSTSYGRQAGYCYYGYDDDPWHENIPPPGLDQGFPFIIRPRKNDGSYYDQTECEDDTKLPSGYTHQASSDYTIHGCYCYNKDQIVSSPYYPGKCYFGTSGGVGNNPPGPLEDGGNPYDAMFRPEECGSCNSGLTTVSVGAESADACVCQAGSFTNPLPPAVLHWNPSVMEETMTDSTTVHEESGLSWHVASNGGFTIIMKARIDSAPSSPDCAGILDIASSSASDASTFVRIGENCGYQHFILEPTTTSCKSQHPHLKMTYGDTYTIVLTYEKSTETIGLYYDTSSIFSRTCSSEATMPCERTACNGFNSDLSNYIAVIGARARSDRRNWGVQGKIYGVYGYDEVLTDAQIQTVIDSIVVDGEDDARVLHGGACTACPTEKPYTDPAHGATAEAQCQAPPDECAAVTPVVSANDLIDLAQECGGPCALTMSSENADPWGLVSNLLDRDTLKHWHSLTHTNAESVTIDLGAVKYVDHVNLTPQLSYACRSDATVYISSAPAAHPISPADAGTLCGSMNIQSQSDDAVKDISCQTNGRYIHLLWEAETCKNTADAANHWKTMMEAKVFGGSTAWLSGDVTSSMVNYLRFPGLDYEYRLQVRHLSTSTPRGFTAWHTWATQTDCEYDTGAYAPCYIPTQAEVRAILSTTPQGLWEMEASPDGAFTLPTGEDEWSFLAYERTEGTLDAKNFVKMQVGKAQPEHQHGTNMWELADWDSWWPPWLLENTNSWAEQDYDMLGVHMRWAPFKVDRSRTVTFPASPPTIADVLVVSGSEYRYMTNIPVSGEFTVSISDATSSFYSAEHKKWTVVAQGWIASHTPPSDWGSQFVYSIDQSGPLPEHTQVRYQCARENNDGNVVVFDRITGLGGCSSGAPYTECHNAAAQFGTSEPGHGRFIIREGVVHCTVDYTQVGGDSDNPKSGLWGRVSIMTTGVEDAGTKVTSAGGTAWVSQWKKGVAGSTCDATCALVNLECDSYGQSQVDNAEKVVAAFAEAGYTCKSTGTLELGYAGSPFSTGRDSDDCYFFTANAGSGEHIGLGSSSCNGNVNPAHAPLCKCVSPLNSAMTGTMQTYFPRPQIVVQYHAIACPPSSDSDATDPPPCPLDGTYVASCGCPADYYQTTNGGDTTCTACPDSLIAPAQSTSPEHCTQPGKKVTFSLALSGAVSAAEFTPSLRGRIKAKIAQNLRVSPKRVTIVSVQDARRRLLAVSLEVEVTAEDQAQAQTLTGETTSITSAVEEAASEENVTLTAELTSSSSTAVVTTCCFKTWGV